MTKLSKVLGTATVLSLLLPVLTFAQTSVNVQGSVGATTNTTGITGSATVTGSANMKVRPRTINGTTNSVSGTTITMTADNSTTLTIDASSAKVVRKFGGAMQASDIQVGDKLQVRGTLNGTNVTATVVRDMSLQAKDGTFSGTAQSAVSNGSFQLQSKERGMQTVNISSSTIIKKNGKVATSSDIVFGSKIRVSGVWDSANKQITAKNIGITVKIQKANIKGSISAISGNTLTVAGTDNVVYTVDITNAKLVRKFGGASNISEFKTGDAVQVRGSASATPGSINALLVRDLSITAKSLKGAQSK